jgi:predicted nucleotidyltransferase
MNVTDIRNTVAQVAPSYPVLSIDLFGSFARGDNSENSDVDLLVYFDESVASLFDLSGLKYDIQAKLNTRVDVVAGPLKKDSYLVIDRKVRIYEA